MTDVEWLECREWESIFGLFPQGLTGRKLHLFACACCRRIWHLMHGGSQRVVELAEGRADDFGGHEEVRAAVDASQRDHLDPVATNAVAAVSWFTDQDVVRGVSMISGNAACCVAMKTVPGHRTGEWEAVKATEEAEQAAVFREVTGNPFYRHTINPLWLTPTVPNLAAAAYQERALPSGELDPHRLAVLADALEDAGCTNSDLLGHLRSPGPHVRGCWALDLILGKG
jgi:hypothetical protein